MRRPSLPVLVVAGLVTFGICFAVFLSDSRPVVPEGTPLVTADLRFEDRLDGAVAVYEGNAAEPSTLLAPGTNAFIRTTLRSMARGRRIQEAGDGPATPFRLTLFADGSLILEDTATARTLNLRAYGDTNALAFAQLLPAREGSR